MDWQTVKTQRTVVFCGLRFYSEDNTARKFFPLEEVPAVRNAIRDLFRSERATRIVTGFVLGADILALDVARDLGIDATAISCGDEDTCVRFGPEYDVFKERKADHKRFLQETGRYVQIELKEEEGYETKESRAIFHYGSVDTPSFRPDLAIVVHHPILRRGDNTGLDRMTRFIKTAIERRVEVHQIFTRPY